MGKTLFVGGRLDSLGVVAGVPAEVTSGGLFDATYADAALQVNASDVVDDCYFTDPAGAPTTVVLGETLFCHFDLRNNPSGTVGNAVTIKDSSGNPWFALRHVASGQLQLAYNSGTGAVPIWTTLGAPVVVSNLLVRWDIKLTLGSPHTVELFKDNNPWQVPFTFSQASFTNAYRLHCGHPSAGVNFGYYSQILCTEGLSTINARVKYSRATGAGNSSGWTGVFGNVNEPINNDATVLSAGAAGLRTTLAMGDVTVPAGFYIAGVHYWNRMKNDGASPLTSKAVMRIGGFDYVNPTAFAGVGLGFLPKLHRYDVSPATGLIFSQAEFNGVELGHDSAP